jgi:lysophospholipase L1-like esterase
MSRRVLAVLATFCLVAVHSSTAHEGHQHDEPTPEERLPRVLILGDSITMGYTPIVQQMLSGEADVVRPDENCGATAHGLERLDAWLGDGHWDVIHFNFGLHDLKYVDGQGETVPPEQGAVQVPLDTYEANLEQIVQRLRQTGAKLIWGSTTPVPAGAVGRIADDAVHYNAVAQRVLRRRLGEERVVNDLHAYALPRLAEIQQPANVHFTPAGSQALAEQVASAIRQQLNPLQEPTEVGRGVVYHDQNGNRVLDADDTPLSDIKVSNGQEIVTTDAQGRYELPVGQDTTVFVIKPRGYKTPVDDKQLPQFYYIHKPDGSPPSHYAGVSPTGALPSSIDFALYPQREPDKFRAILFGDPQPRNQQEVDFIAHDVVEELIGTDASFGVTLGDIAFDALEVFEPQARAIAILGIPWYNVIGNHDVNYDAREDRHSDETFERVFGPNYYSFDYGPVHFLVLDDIEWLIDENGEGRYQGGLGPRQMAFIRRDLEMISPDQLVVLMMHIPLTDVRDRHELYRLIEQRPFCMSISAHQHTHEHRYITHADGWRGPERHHHVVNVTVSGSWWSGTRDERGIPHATMADGAPNGYSIIAFDGHRYQLDFKAAGRSKDYQMSIRMPERIDPASDGSAQVDVFANIFNGAEDTTVTIAVGDAGPANMTYTLRPDPTFVELAREENERREKLLAQGEPEDRLWRAMPRPGTSTHLWHHTLDASSLADGTHLVTVTATFADGRSVTGRRLFRVERTADVPPELARQLPEH